MPTKLQAIRGMGDVLMDETPIWQHVEREIGATFAQYGYREIRLPIVEKTALFARSIGEQSDIVSKEMYSFSDRNNDSLTLRPEATAGCVRAGVEHGLLHNQIQRLWYMGPMFRHERPQKGRRRQFHQAGAETYGLAGPDIDAELIRMCAKLWQRLHIKGLRLELNSLGSPAAREGYRAKLVEYFSAHMDQLDEDGRKRIESNPLRILDSKNQATSDLIANAPGIIEHLDQESKQHFSGLCKALDKHQLAYQVNPRLVRGLDYYNKTVFEWISDDLGAQGTVCGGGRYDGLVNQFGGRDTPAAGFAIGLERLITLADNSATTINNKPHVYFIPTDETTIDQSIALSESLRDQIPELRVLMHCGTGSLKSRFKQADQSGAAIALILGGAELNKQSVGVKLLRKNQDQTEIAWEALPTFLRQRLFQT